MEHFDLPPVALVTLFFSLGTLSIVALAIGLPLAIFRLRTRCDRASWDGTRETILASGAYRAMSVVLPVRAQIPRVVRAATLFSLYMAIPAVLAVPIVFVGVGVELDAHRVGPAFVLGVPGLVIACAIVLIGMRATKRSASLARIARVVAFSEMTFAIALAMAIAMTLLPDELAVVVALAFAHAFVLAAAANAHDNVRACA